MWNNVDIPLKMVVFPWKMVIFHSYVDGNDIYTYIWLMVDLPLWKMMVCEFVSWDDEPFPIYEKIENDPNDQANIYIYSIYTLADESAVSQMNTNNTLRQTQCHKPSNLRMDYSIAIENGPNRNSWFAELKDGDFLVRKLLAYQYIHLQWDPFMSMDWFCWEKPFTPETPGPVFCWFWWGKPWEFRLRCSLPIQWF